MNEGNLERPLFDILPRFPNIQTIDLEHNNTKSLQGIEYRIKTLERISSSTSSLSSSPPSLQTVLQDNKLQKLILQYNPIASKVSLDSAIYDPEVLAALITILDAFNGIY